MADGPDAPKGDEAARQLQEQLESLRDYRRAIESEFKDVKAGDDDASDKAMQSVIQLVPDAAETIGFLLNHAESENVRASLAKWVYDKVLKRVADREGDDELSKLVKQLSGSPE